jgi:hypothetical protein
MRVGSPSFGRLGGPPPWWALGLAAFGLLPGCPAGEPEATCAPGTRLDAVDVDDLGCVPDRCGGGPFPDPGEAEAVYVAPWGADADEGGRGTRQAPFARVRDGVAEAESRGGGTVLLAAGEWREPLRLAAGVDLAVQGRCAALTSLVQDEGEDPAAFASGVTAVVSDLSLVGGRIGVWVDEHPTRATSLTLQRVASVAPRLIGLLVRGPDAVLSVFEVSVDGAVPSPEGQFGRGVEVQGGLLDGTDLRLTGNTDRGLVVNSAGEARLGALVIDDTALRPDGLEGVGLLVLDGSQVEVTGLRMTGNHQVGVGLSGVGSALVLSDAEIRDTLPLPDGRFGRGLEVSLGASLAVDGLLVQGCAETGLSLAGLGTTAQLDDVTVRGTLPRPDGTGGRGVDLWAGVAVQGRGLRVEGNREIGLRVADGADVVLEDVTVADTASRSDGELGRGISVGDGGTLQIVGGLIEQNQEVGIQVVGEGSRLVLSDAVVRNTRPREDGLFGRGIQVHDGGSLELVRAEVSSNRDAALAVVSGGTASLTDVVLAGTSSSGNELTGAGLVVQNGAVVTAEGLVARDNEISGLHVVEGASLVATDVELRGNGFAGALTRASRVVLRGGVIAGNLPSPSEGGGVGIFVGRGAAGASVLRVEDVTFEAHLGPALYLRGPGAVEMSDCTIRDSGTWPSFPGGVLAVEGWAPWEPDGGPQGTGWGLRLAGNRFEDLAGDAIVLDGASARLEVSGLGAPNRFEGVAGAPLFVQRCDGVAPVELVDGSGVEPTCRDVPRPLGPLLDFAVWTSETSALP